MKPEIAEAIKLISSLKPPEHHCAEKVSGRFRLNLDDTKISCMCGQFKPLSEMEIFNTGVIQAFNNVCKNCPSAKKEDRKTARIVCCSCKRVISRVVPLKDQIGFRYEPNRTYHVDKCGFCNPGLKESIILEKLLYDREHSKNLRTK